MEWKRRRNGPLTGRAPALPEMSEGIVPKGADEPIRNSGPEAKLGPVPREQQGMVACPLDKPK